MAKKANTQGNVNPENAQENVNPENAQENAEKFAKKAKELMKRLSVKEVYRTSDGQYFTNLQYAEAHCKKIKGNLFTYK
jgi:hypothetical protein